MYIPPFTVSSEAINLIAEISGLIERYAIRLEQEDGLRLRKVNRIKTIHSFLAIDEAGMFRRSGVGVFEGEKPIHIAPSAG